MNSELSRIHALVDDDGTSHLAEYAYVGVNRTAQVDFPDIDATNATPGAKFTWIMQSGESPTDGGDQYTGWDRFGRAIDLRWIKNSSGAELERLQHGYDRASNRLYRKNLVAADTDKQDELYTYDGLYQLGDFKRGLLNEDRDGMDGSLAAREQFAFDPTGNWNSYVVNAGTPQTRTHNAANELTEIDSASTYVGEDAAGNMTTVPQPGSWSAGYDLKYDAWNRLVEVKEDSTTVATYAYDGLNRRTKKVVGSDTRHFYYTDQWQIIEERLNTSTSADRQFVWGIRYTDDLVLRDRGSERLYAIQDYFQPTAVMDEDGAVQERYGYEAFGTSRVMDADFVTQMGGSSFDWETRLGAYRWDAETGLFQVRFRYLHTGLGRWVTRDPIGYRAGLNLFAYANNSPHNRIDPFGLIAGIDDVATGGMSTVALIVVIGLIFTGVKNLAKCISSSDSESEKVESNCTVAELAELNKAVGRACKGPSMRCNYSMDCTTLSANITAFTTCIAARHLINIKCFGGKSKIELYELENLSMGLNRCLDNWLNHVPPCG